MGGLQTRPTQSQWQADPKGKSVKAKIDAGQELSYDDYLVARQAGLDTSAAFTSKTSLTPDLTDSAARAAKMGQVLSLISGRGRRQSMLNGEYDDSMLAGFNGDSMLGGF